MDSVPPPDQRLATVLHEMYAGLTPERTARAYLLVSARSEAHANRLINEWLDVAYNQGYEAAQLVAQRNAEREKREFVAEARRTRSIYEAASTALGARHEAEQGGQGVGYPGGPLPTWGPTPPGYVQPTPRG